jgi:hypothetical protein
MAAISSITITVSSGSIQRKQVRGVPWFPGITVLEAMVIGQAMAEASFNFRVVYHSKFGAFVDLVDYDAEGAGKYWILRLNGEIAKRGPSEEIIDQPEDGVAEIGWALQLPPPAGKTSHLTRRLAESA